MQFVRAYARAYTFHGKAIWSLALCGKDEMGAEEANDYCKCSITCFKST